MSWLVDPSAWIALLTLTALEVVLGVDNVIFISILAGRLPRREQALARRVGLVLAALSRIALLLSINWLARLRAPLFTLFGQGFSGRDLILMGGGLFLVAKATYEIHQRLEGEEGHATARVAPSLGSVVAQIVLLDLVFSLDSVITAVGMARQVEVGEDACAELPAAHWSRAHRRGVWTTHPPRLHLLRHGVLGVRGATEPADPAG